MNNIVDLQELQKEIKNERENKYIHAQASFTVLKSCLDYLNMNNLEELKKVKKEIISAMNKMKEISIDGKR